MKKLLLLTMLLGLTGCGDNNQSDTTQTNVQATTLQKAEAVPAVANYSLTASARVMGAVAPLAGWNVTKSTVMGASTLIDAIKDAKVSAALVSPNAKQVAEVLRGGAAGVALSLAVEQLLGAVDWVLDPANNQIKYKVPLADGSDQTCQKSFFYNGKYYCNEQTACKAHAAYFVELYGRHVSFKSASVDSKGNALCVMNWYGSTTTFTLPLIDRPEQTFPLETIAEKVITNADAGSLDAQVATSLAAQNILNDMVQAEPVVQELENNASEKCDQNTNPSCKKECEPPAGVKFNKVTHFERHGRDPDINVGSHGCMAKTGSPVHWHYDVNHQLPDGRCFLKGHNFGGCGVAP
ncbi:hypothetical protein [Acinetobacter courvalinii]|uniref:hypothetical protein n=1 Tax=Acinetobacter courvalinii TaxID=280147 RepID=UPI002897215E|nr:hypothetical protein [Acinetobacter courvalinii]